MIYAIHSTLNGIILVSAVGFDGSMAEHNRGTSKSRDCKKGGERAQSFSADGYHGNGLTIVYSANQVMEIITRIDLKRDSDYSWRFMRIKMDSQYQ